LLGDLPEQVRAPADSVLRQRTGDADVVEGRQERVLVTSRHRAWLWSAVSNEQKRLSPDIRSDFWLWHTLGGQIIKKTTQASDIEKRAMLSAV
jgi:hypothetical protein